MPASQENLFEHNVPLSKAVLIFIIHFCRIVLRKRAASAVQDEQINKILNYSDCIDVSRLPVQSVERSVLFLTVEWVVSRRTSLLLIC